MSTHEILAWLEHRALINIKEAGDFGALPIKYAKHVAIAHELRAAISHIKKTFEERNAANIAALDRKQVY